MQLQDDRTDEEKLTHNVLVIGLDRWMSGWGKAEGGHSYAAWATEADYVLDVYEAVKERGDMSNVHIWYGPGEYPENLGANDHFHIYVVRDGRCGWSTCSEGDE